MNSIIPSIIGAAEMDLKPIGLRDGYDQGNPEVCAKEISNGDGIHVGVWECAPGGWPVVNRADTEVATIISGTATVTDLNGTTQSLAAGSVITLPKGWSGRWDILETLRKVYVIVK